MQLTLFVLLSTTSFFVLADPTCGAGAVYYTALNSCIYALTRKEWYTAELSCIQLGGHLVTLLNEADSDLLIAHAKQYFVTGDFWIGLDGRGNFADNTPLNYTNYNATLLKPSDCTKVSVTTGIWATDNCFNSYNYLCSVPPTDQCDDGWTLYNNYCYKKFIGGYTFKDSNSNCRNISAELASIHSYDDNQFIFTFIPPDDGSDFVAFQSWIGGVFSHDFANHTTYWMDGTNVEYVNYMSEPGNETKYCLQMFTDYNFHNVSLGMWTDVLCDTQLNNHICRKPANV